MGKHTVWLTHRKYQILLVSFVGISDENEFLACFDEMEQEMVQHSQGKIVPAIVDLTNTRLSSAYTARGRSLVNAMKAANVPDSPVVLVGTTGLQKASITAFSIFRHDIFTCDTVDEAKDMLVQYLRKQEAAG